MQTINDSLGVHLHSLQSMSRDEVSNLYDSFFLPLLTGPLHICEKTVDVLIEHNVISPLANISCAILHSDKYHDTRIMIYLKLMKRGNEERFATFISKICNTENVHRDNLSMTDKYVSDVTNTWMTHGIPFWCIRHFLENNRDEYIDIYLIALAKTLEEYFYLTSLKSITNRFFLLQTDRRRVDAMKGCQPNLMCQLDILYKCLVERVLQENEPNAHWIINAISISLNYTFECKKTYVKAIDYSKVSLETLRFLCSHMQSSLSVDVNEWKEIIISGLVSHYKKPDFEEYMNVVIGKGIFNPKMYCKSGKFRFNNKVHAVETTILNLAAFAKNIYAIQFILQIAYRLDLMILVEFDTSIIYQNEKHADRINGTKIIGEASSFFLHYFHFFELKYIQRHNAILRRYFHGIGLYVPLELECMILKRLMNHNINTFNPCEIETIVMEMSNLDIGIIQKCIPNKSDEEIE